MILLPFGCYVGAAGAGLEGEGGRGRGVEADPPDQTFQSPVWGHPQPVGVNHPSFPQIEPRLYL